MLGDAFEELETLDQPRGVVAAANRYAAKKVPIEELPLQGPNGPLLLKAARVIYKHHFDAFIEGAKWASALPPQPSKIP